MLLLLEQLTLGHPGGWIPPFYSPVTVLMIPIAKIASSYLLLGMGDTFWHIILTLSCDIYHDVVPLLRNLVFATSHLFFHELHWLPVCHRINFKIVTITFKVLQFQQPSYLIALIPWYVPSRSLRSSSSLSLCVPNQKTGMAKSKSFSSVA